MNDPGSSGDMVTFAHEAMKTTFHLRMPAGDPRHQRSVAQLCFDTIDRLESQLSRFVDGSDVSRINAMQAGESLFISEACHACLVQALHMYQATGGLFDITLGSRIEHLKSGAEGDAPELRGHLTVAPDRPLIICESPGRQIDLGGIGKGFALDRLRSLLADWEIGSALVSAGNSTQLAIGEKDWIMDLAGDADRLRIDLRNEALSASGTGIQGSHLVHPDPDRDAGEPLSFQRVWLTAPSAAEADAWSTAILLMTESQVRELGTDRPRRLYVEDAAGIRPWLD